MDKIRHRLSDTQREFFDNLSIYIDKPLYFYGSIYRMDYLPGKSDIDLDLFTESETSTIQMLCNYLNMNKNEFKKSFYKINSTIVNGYKAKYKDEQKQIDIELSVYNEKYKPLILEEHDRCKSLPFHISIILVIVKFFYYTLGVLSTDMYRVIKLNLMNPGSEFKFILVDS